MKYLSVGDLAIRYNVSIPTIWNWRKNYETFPKPVKLGPQVTRWRLDEIEAWEARRDEVREIGF